MAVLIRLKQEVTVKWAGSVQPSVDCFTRRFCPLVLLPSNSQPSTSVHWILWYTRLWRLNLRDPSIQVKWRLHQKEPLNLDRLGHATVMLQTCRPSQYSREGSLCWRAVRCSVCFLKPWLNHFHFSIDVIKSKIFVNVIMMRWLFVIDLNGYWNVLKCFSKWEKFLWNF